MNIPVSSTVYVALSGTPEIVYVVSGTAVIVHTLPAFVVPSVTVAFVISVLKVTVIIKALTSEGRVSLLLFIIFFTLKLPVALDVLYTFSKDAAVAVPTVPPTTVTTIGSVEEVSVYTVFPTVLLLGADSVTVYLFPTASGTGIT